MKAILKYRRGGVIVGNKSGCEGAGNILYWMIMDGRIGYGLSPLMSIRWRKRDIVLAALRGRVFPDPIKKIIGHEVLFRSVVGSEDELLRRCVGPAFGQMTENGKQMIEAYPVLLEKQLKFINRLSDGKKKSINLEYLVWDDYVASDKVFQLLSDNGTVDLITEIKEDGMMPEWAMCELSCVCEDTDTGVYIDDMAMKVNNVPENIKYFQALIKHLHHHIRAIKIDYAWVIRMKGDPSVKRHIDLNLHDFAYIWRCYTDLPLPTVIFESFPFDRIKAMQIVFGMSKQYGYGRCYFQSESSPKFRRRKFLVG